MVRTNLANQTLADATAEQVRRSHHDALSELQASPLAGAKVVSVKLENGKATTVSHGLGRVPKAVLVSVVRGATTSAGYIKETREAVDPSKAVMLTASGYGATVQVDVVLL